MPKLLTRFAPVTASIILLLVAVCATGYMSLRPQVASATSVSTSTVVTLNVTTGIAITVSAGVTPMSTALGIAQNSAVGTTTWTVDTNDVAGYSMTLNATNTPAMASSTATSTVYVLDYPATSTPTFWTTPGGTAYFGFSAFGPDTLTATYGTGASCSGATSNATSTTLKYRGFSTTTIPVAARTSTTTPSGVVTTVCYAVEQNNYFIQSGAYQATIIATATAL